MDFKDTASDVVVCATNRKMGIKRCINSVTIRKIGIKLVEPIEKWEFKRFVQQENGYPSGVTNRKRGIQKVRPIGKWEFKRKIAIQTVQLIEK